MNDTETPPVHRGWGWPLNSRKAHYFNDELVSLCGRWMYSGKLEDSFDESPDNCSECRRKVKALRAKDLEQENRKAAEKGAREAFFDKYKTPHIRGIARMMLEECKTRKSALRHLASITTQYTQDHQGILTNTQIEALEESSFFDIWWKSIRAGNGLLDEPKGV